MPRTHGGTDPAEPAGPAVPAGPFVPAVAAAHLSPRFVGLLAGLAALASVVGVAVPGTYHDVPALVRETWRAQDIVTLASVVVLVAAWRRARAGSLGGHLVVLGMLTWLAYGYAHLAFGAPFNRIFLVYLAVLALAGWGLIDGIVRLDVTRPGAALADAPVRAAAWYLLVAGAGIAALWLSDIALGVAGGTPSGLHLGVLPNPTWVLDLGWIIPMAVAAGVLMLRRRDAGLLLGSVTLIAVAVLCAAMLALTPVALVAGLAEDPTVASQLIAFTVVFTVLGGIETWLLVRAARHWSAPGPGWLRETWWTGGPVQGDAGR